MPLLTSRSVLPLILSAAALATAGCSAPAAKAGTETFQVAASFYPVQYLAERIAGDSAAVTGLTPAGQEPHSVVLTGPDLVSLQESDLVFYIGNGLQADVEKALSALPEPQRTVDLLQAPELNLITAQPHAQAHHGEAEAGHEAHGSGATDPHFWLDPSRYAAAARTVASEMSAADPQNAQSYAANLESLTKDLNALDTQLEADLSQCAAGTLVVAHSAFGYFADRYGFEQVGIAGLSPDDEPDARTLAEITEAAQSADVPTVFFEEALPPKLAETVAAAAGAEVSALDTAEFVPETGDYLDLMRANGQSAHDGLGCK